LVMKRFEEWLEIFPAISIATGKDNESLLTFFNQTQMKGKGLSLSYDRSPNYFAFLNASSPTHYVLILRDGNEIQGTGTLIIRPGVIQGQKKLVGYLGDLRVTNPRKWGLYWRKFYQKLMKEKKEIVELQDVDHWYTCLLSENLKAKKALIRSREGLGYEFYSDYAMVNLIAEKPWHRSHYRAFEASDTESVRTFLKDQYLRRDFGFVFENEDELLRRLENWSGLQGLLVVKEGETILGATLLWDPSEWKRIIIQNLPLGAKLSGHLMRCFKKWPREKEELKCLYPTLFQVRDDLPQKEREAVASALFSESLKIAQRKGYHVLSVASFTNEPWSEALRGFFSLSTALQFYTVDPGKEIQHELTRFRAPGFEMGLV
jgi:hypothetical protein